MNPLANHNGSTPRLALTDEAVWLRRALERVTGQLRACKAELREVQQWAQVGTWEWNAATDAYSGSDELWRMFGYAPPAERIPAFREQSGRLYASSAWAKLHDAMQTALASGTGFACELPALRDGAELWVKVTATLARGSTGEVVGLRGTVQDITVRKEAEHKLRDSEQRELARAAELAALLDAVPTPVFIAYDPECRHITGNRAADELLRNPRGAEASLTASAETRPRHFRVFKDGCEMKPEDLPAQLAAKGFPVQGFEEHLVFDDGTSCDVLAYTTTLRDEAGQPRGSVLVLIDISERKRAEQALQAREEQLRSFVHHAPATMAMFDRGMNYVAASQQWINDYGPRDRPLSGVNIYAAHPDLPERWKEIHRQALAGVSQAKDEDLWLQGDGTQVWLRWSVRPWHDAQGCIGGVMILAENISARKRVEEALRQSEERLRLVLEASRIGTFEIDLRSGIAHWNRVEFELLGLAPGSVVPGPSTFFKYVHPADLQELEQRWAEAVRGGELDAEFRTIGADGRERWLAGKGRFAFDASVPAGPEERRPSRFLGVNFDVTERKRAEEALAESERRFAGIVRSALDAIISVSSAQRIVLFNAAAERMFQCPASEALGSPLERFMPEPFRALHADHVGNLNRDPAGRGVVARTAMLTGLRANGEEFPIEASVSEIEHGDETFATVIIRDISERRRLEREVLEVSSREQRRIGRELHDDVCQWLAGTELLSSTMAKRLASEGSMHAAEAEKIVQNLRQALVRARGLARGLEPPVIESEGLAPALAELAATTAEMFHLQCRYDGPARVDIRDDVAALHLHRIAQEAITNAVRHGAARHVEVELRAASGHVTLIIRDDGRGFSQPAAETSGMGLRNMRYRAGIIGATFEVRAPEAGGTEVICSFPNHP